MPRMPTEPCIRARRYGAGRPVLSWRWRLGPARFGRYRKPMGGVGVLPYLLPSTALIAHERRLSLSHFLDNALHFLDNASHFLEDHQSLLCRLCFA
jgi:hypothetical protein